MATEGMENKMPLLRLALPKGRMQDSVLQLLRDAGVGVKFGAREYRPTIDLPGYDVKLLKPQNILEMLHVGSRDVGFAGHDWVMNLGVHVIELLDLELDPVRIVAAAPDKDILLKSRNCSGDLKRLLVASEYETLTMNWIRDRGLNATFVRAFGATESFPPEDADLIVDNTATGSTLKANALAIVDEVLKSSTRLYCSKAAYDDPVRRAELDKLVLLIKSVLVARTKVIVQFNVAAAALEAILRGIPAMRAPTVSKLFGEEAYAVSIAIPRKDAAALLPNLKSMGATDIILTQPQQIVA